MHLAESLKHIHEKKSADPLESQGLMSMPFKLRRPGRSEPKKLEIKLKTVTPQIEMMDPSQQYNNSEFLNNSMSLRNEEINIPYNLQDSRALQLVLIKKKRPFFNKVVSIPTRFVTPQKLRESGSELGSSRAHYIGPDRSNSPGPGAYELDPAKRRNIEAIRVELMRNPFLGVNKQTNSPITGLPSSNARVGMDQNNRSFKRDDMPLAANGFGNEGGLMGSDRRLQPSGGKKLSQDAGLLVTLLGQNLRRGQSHEPGENSDLQEQFDRIFTKDRQALHDSTTFFGIPLNERNRAAIKRKMYEMLQQLTGTKQDLRLLSQIRNQKRRSPGASNGFGNSGEDSLYGHSRLAQNDGTAVFRSSSMDAVMKIKAPTPGPGSYDIPTSLGQKGTSQPDPAFRSRQVRFSSPHSNERYHHMFYSKDRNRPPTPTKKSFHLNKQFTWNP